MTAIVLQGDARCLPLPDKCVDLVVTSPPYFGLRSYEDDGAHYDGQIGSEATPHDWLEQMLACTVEWIRVLKPTGSIWVNLGDKYSDRAGPSWVGSSDRFTHRPPKPRRPSSTSMAPRKSLLGLPWRYAIACMDQLGLILREEVIWEKPNALPESVRDRARRSHEQWFHFTVSGSYYADVDALRVPHTGNSHDRRRDGALTPKEQAAIAAGVRRGFFTESQLFHPLGRLPGSVWTVPAEPLAVPAHLGVDHFAAYPTELPRRIITGFAPTGICLKCDEPRRQIYAVVQLPNGKTNSGRAKRQRPDQAGHDRGFNAAGYPHTDSLREWAGEACWCGTWLVDDPDEAGAPATRPAKVLDPFGGTGTTALVASVLGRIGITVDLSHDYSRIATWRTQDPRERARAARRPPPPAQTVGQHTLFDLSDQD